MKETLACIWLMIGTLPADEDRFRENFADPETRTAALAELTPGTRDAFFFTALDHQLGGREAEFQDTLATWRATAEKADGISRDGLEVLENRQILLDYERDPVGTLEELARRMNLNFDVSRPDADAAVAALPTRVDPDLISEAAFEAEATKRSQPGRQYERMKGVRLWQEMDEVEMFDEVKVRWFLEKFPRADHPGAVALTLRGLELEEPVRFGSAEIHRQMTWRQLDELLMVRPALRSNEDFMVAYLRKMRPGADTDFRQDRVAHAAHLANCRDVAMDLPPALDSLKAHVLFHHLRLQRELGNHPAEDFVAFLMLPRTGHALLRQPEFRRSEAVADLAKDYESATGCGPVGDDTALVEALLHHFLAEVDSAEVFEPLVEEKALARIHARARLLAGGDPERWGRQLDAAEARELREETWIRFAPGAPEFLEADAAAALPVELKNTPELLVRIYELDLPSYLARTGREPQVDVDLDGLVPHHERRIAFAQSPWVLHRESLELPELEGPGAWLVELVGGQVSARALIRKGRLIPYLERTAGGQVVRVFDEKGNEVMNAEASLGRETIAADETGRIFIPNAPNQPATRGIVRAGKRAAVLSVESRRDSLELDARFVLDREQLLADMEARLNLRVRLTNHGHELPLDRLENPALTLSAELLGEVRTERVIADDLKLEPTMNVPFQVPADMLSLTLTLSGTVTPTTGDDPEKLQVSETFTLNTSLKESRIENAFFTRTAEGHRLELRGRNGEPLPSRALWLRFNFQGYNDTVALHVRTDDAGRVELGELEGIGKVRIDLPTMLGEVLSSTSVSYDPIARWISPPDEIHVLADEEIRLPLQFPDAGLRREWISLMELIDEKPVRDYFDLLEIDGNQLVIRGLPAGDFEFKQDGIQTILRASGGVRRDDLLISRTRILPSHRPATPAITEAVARDGELEIRLAGAGEGTRVSLIGQRYEHNEWDLPGALRPFERPLPPVLEPGFMGNAYLTERRLSDEMRYILDRRAARVFPGSMLPRPGLLLNRWTDQDLKQADAEGGEGADGVLSEPPGRPPAYTGPPMDDKSRHDMESTEVVDFLAMPSVVKFDLQPDADGVVRVPLADFEGSQFVTVVVVDDRFQNVGNVPLPANDVPLRDRRIARPFDPEMHYLATRNAAALAKDAEARIENLLDADWRAFTTLAEAHQFLYGMTSDERLREMIFLTEWPTLAEERKLELLAKHACHEFHLFLARKDQPFFEAHVKPMLASKMEPRFIDDLLLERDLVGYLRPFAWSRLNAAEKALLSQALPEARERISRELELRWKLEKPAPDEETVLFSQTLRGTDLATEDSLGLARRELEVDSHVGSGVAYINEKLRRIIIPTVNFEDTTVEEAIDFLRMRAAELDTLELDPARKGVNFVVRAPRGEVSRIDELRLRNVPLEVVLKYIGDKTKLRYRMDDYAVTLTPMTEVGEDLFTRNFAVPPGFAEALAGYSDGPDPFAASDPFSAETGGSGLMARAPIAELLRQAGINLPAGASATLSPNGTLLVTAPPSELDKVEQLTQSHHSEVPGHRSPSEELADSYGEFVPQLEAPAAMGRPVQRAQAGQRLLFPEQTKLWRESNYYRHRGAADESLIPLNRFWLDLAAWDGEGIFLSPHFNACHHSVSDALMCLALLDLPFSAERPEIAVEGQTMRVKAREPMLLFYKDTRQTADVAEDQPLLIRQFFHPLDEAMRTENDRQVENPVRGDFRPNVAYGAWMVVTNPAGVQRRVDVLAQIPAGAIPLAARPATLSETKEIRPYGVLHFHLAFYFPAPGDFPVYPIHVSEEGVVLGTAQGATLRVSAEPAPDDSDSWQMIARDGTPEQVLERLRTENLQTIELGAIRWRLRDRGFYMQVMEILEERLHHSPALASFSLFHDDLPGITNYLENSALVKQLGRWFESALINVHPRVHHGWQTLEFDPLINPRAHRFTGKSRLSHDEARAHYHALLDQLAWKPALSADDQVTLVVFLMLQDRVAEALERFDLIDPADLPDRLHYDYVNAVVHFHRGQPEEARRIAEARLPSLPPGLWQDRFATVVEQAEEIVALAAPAGQDQEKADDPAAPSLDLAMAADGRLTMRHRGLDLAALQLFHVDLEVLFSKDPFLTGGGKDTTHPAIMANEARTVELQGEGETALELPEQFRQGNALVSATAGETRLLRVLDSRGFEIRRQPEDRTLQALDAAGSKPLPGSYVKVFAETNGGEVDFHKDGYTDLRGKFDYISHTGTDVSTIRRFAVLVSHPELGARTMIYER